MHLATPGILTVTLSSARDLAIDNTSDLISIEDPEERRKWLVYAVLDFGGSQVFSEAKSYSYIQGRRGPKRYVWWPGTTNAPWAERSSTFHFDVSEPSELTVYLFAKNCNPAAGRLVPTSLGVVKLDPFLVTWAPGEHCVDVQDGTGQVSLDVCYLEKVVPTLEDAGVWNVRRVVRLGNLVRIEKKDTNRTFLMRTIISASAVTDHETAESLRSRLRIEHPFIAPLEFVFRSPGGLSLLSSLASGGHLFSYLQRERCFEVGRAKMHSAEFICAIEYLHGRNIILGALKPENIALDSFGHVNLCMPGIFALKSQGGYQVISGDAEIPAPELLLGQEATKTSDWWSLGVLLFEMLTGTPPFYHDDPDVRKRWVIDQHLHLEHGLPTAASDILRRLLDKDSTRRLGANGVEEIKAHQFFPDVSWLNLTQRNRDMLFEPSEGETVFRLHPDLPTDTKRYHETSEQRVTDEGVVEKEIYWDVFRTKFWYSGKVKEQEGFHSSNF